MLLLLRIRMYHTYAFFNSLSNTSDVSLSVPENRIVSNLELKDNPVLQSEEPFWSDPNAPPSTDDDIEDEGEIQMDTAPVVTAKSEDVSSSGSSPSPSLMETIRAATLVLNVPFRSPMTLPGNDTAFTRFASSVPLPTFDAFVTTVTLKDTDQKGISGKAPAASANTAQDSDDESEESDTPKSWIHDKLGFSASLFQPQFPHPSISQPPSVPILPENQSPPSPLSQRRQIKRIMVS